MATRSLTLVWSAALVAAWLVAAGRAMVAGAQQAPELVFDPTWPKELPNNWKLGGATGARSYSPVSAGLDRDLTYRLGPIDPVLAGVHPLLTTPIDLRPEEFQNLVAFVCDGLLDERATRQNLCRLVPSRVPSGFPTMRFETCPQ